MPLKFRTKTDLSVFYDAIVYTGRNLNKVIEFFPGGGVGTKEDFKEVISESLYKSLKKSELLLLLDDGLSLEVAEKGDILLKFDNALHTYVRDKNTDGLVTYGENVVSPIFLQVVTTEPHCPKCLNRLLYGHNLTRDEKTLYSYKCKSCGYKH